MSGDLLRVSVAFAYPDRQVLLSTDLPEGATLRDAIEHSGIRDKVPEINLDTMRVGVFGKLKALDDAVRSGDRVEIYRPLRADPKEARRARAQADKGNK
ncbi:MAG: RnfH family protein [Algiphilus sp.]